LDGVALEIVLSGARFDVVAIDPRATVRQVKTPLFPILGDVVGLAFIRAHNRELEIVFRKIDAQMLAPSACVLFFNFAYCHFAALLN
jgi:hypothetical protein